MTIFYTAEVRQAVPKWVEDVINVYAYSNSNDSYEAQTSIYSERCFSYSIFDRHEGVPLKVKFKEFPDETKTDFQLDDRQQNAVDAAEEKPSVESNLDEDQPEDKGQEFRIAGLSEGECLIQIKEIAIQMQD